MVTRRKKQGLSSGKNRKSEGRGVTLRLGAGGAHTFFRASGLHATPFQHKQPETAPVRGRLSQSEPPPPSPTPTRGGGAPSSREPGKPETRPRRGPLTHTHTAAYTGSSESRGESVQRVRGAPDPEVPGRATERPQTLRRSLIPPQPPPRRRQAPAGGEGGSGVAKGTGRGAWERSRGARSWRCPPAGRRRETDAHNAPSPCLPCLSAEGVR